jgi:PIN domain nuclease of toxin-antitoxin system
VIYLLDTHTLWHHASAGDGLSPLAARLIDEARVEDLRILDISLFELARHMAVGRLVVDDPEETLKTIETSYPVLRSDARIAWTSASMDWPKRNGKGQHLDPADRAIVAAARLHRLTILSADREMHHFGPNAGVPVLW